MSFPTLAGKKQEKEGYKRSSVSVMVGNILRFVNTGYKLLELDGRKLYRAAKRWPTPSAAGRMLLAARDQTTRDHMLFSSASVRNCCQLRLK
jgi:hypothetical protein